MNSILRISPAPWLLLLVALLASSLATADDQAWNVVSISGTVTISAADSDREVPEIEAGVGLQPPFLVTTGDDGHLVLSRGEDTLAVGPGSLLDIPQPVSSGRRLITRINQALGSVLYQVEHRVKDLFEVHTPYLVSVVKGTTFNVLVAADSSTVALIEGLLQLHTPDNRYETFLEAGQAAMMSADGDRIRIEDQRSLSEPVAGPVSIGSDNTRLGANGDHAPVSGDFDVDLRGPAADGDDSILGIADGDSALRLDNSSTGPAAIRINDLSTAALDIEGSSVDVEGVSIQTGGETLPSVDSGDLAADLGGIDAGLGRNLDTSLAVGETSLDVGGTSIGETAITPAIETGDLAADLGSIDAGLGSDLDTSLDIGDASLDVGATSIGETALTPELGLEDTSLEIDDSGLELSTGLDAGVGDPLEVNVETDGSAISDTLSDVEDVVNDSASDLGSSVDTVTDLLPF